jgi:hypothetical protein
MVVSPQAVVFPNSTSFSLTELLKIIQENGIDPLWAEVEDSLEAVIDHASADWGQEVRYSLNVDAGGGAFGRIAQQSGRFSPGDKTRNILGKVYPKYQTFTYQFERFHQKLSKTQAQAYIENAKQEFLMKNMFQKSFMVLQMMGDGTGRQGVPVGFGAAETAAGATFTIADVTTPMKIKLGSTTTSAGCAAWFLEGSMVSVIYGDRDLNDDGADEVTAANSRVRFVSFSFEDAGAGTARAFDAFRVVKVDQEDDAIHCMPGRYSTTVGTDNGAFSQDSEWVASGTGAVTVTPFRGRSADYLAVATDTVFGAQINDLNLILGGETAHYASLIHPQYVAESQAAARLQIGIGWANTTDISTINDGILTGLETLLLNSSNTVHNINRASVMQYLPTIKDNGGKDMTFNTLYAFLAQHHSRNRKIATDWSTCLMNPITYSNMVALSENDRRITEGQGIRGEDGAKYISFGGKKFQLEAHSVMRRDRLFTIANKAITLHDGKIESVEVGGQKEFLSIQNGQRVNINEAYATVCGEMSVKGLRRCGVITNFKTSVL